MLIWYCMLYSFSGRCLGFRLKIVVWIPLVATFDIVSSALETLKSSKYSYHLSRMEAGLFVGYFRVKSFPSETVALWDVVAMLNGMCQLKYLDVPLTSLRHLRGSECLEIWILSNLQVYHLPSLEISLETYSIFSYFQFYSYFIKAKI